MRARQYIKFQAWDPIGKKLIGWDVFRDKQFAVLLQRILYDESSYEIMLYTGSKDKMIREIYVGNILRLDEGYARYIKAERRIVLVGFHSSAYMFGRYEDPYLFNTYVWTAEAEKACEIIGHVKLNPELLEKGVPV